MSFSDKSELKAAIKLSIEAAIAYDRDVPAGVDIFEYMAEVGKGCPQCGHRLERDDAQFINAIDREIQDKIEEVPELLPERQREVVRAMLGHLNVCRGFAQQKNAPLN